MRYKVIGAHTVDGVAPGGFVELDEPQASQLVWAGHVAPAEAPHEDLVEAVLDDSDVEVD